MKDEDSPTKISIKGHNFKKQTTQPFEKNEKNESEGNQESVFSRLTSGGPRHKKNTSISNQRKVEEKDPNLVTEAVSAVNGFMDDHKWKCSMTQENAHSASVCSLATMGN